MCVRLPSAAPKQDTRPRGKASDSPKAVLETIQLGSLSGPRGPSGKTPLRIVLSGDRRGMSLSKVVVVGGGLAGLTAAIEAHANGAHVILLEKTAR